MSAQKISNAERNEASVRKLNDMLTSVPQRLYVPYNKTPNTSKHKSIRKHQINQIRRVDQRDDTVTIDQAIPGYDRKSPYSPDFRRIPKN